MDAKEFFHRYAAQMRREAQDAPSDDLKNSFLSLAQQSDLLAGDGNEDHTLQL